MAQIELRIVADSPDELQKVLAGLADGTIQPDTTGVTAEAGKRGRGRPAGSKNKPTEDAPPAEKPATEAPATPPAETPPAAEAPAAPPAEKPAATEGGPTAELVREKLKAVIDKFGDGGPAKAKGILKDAGGSENITTLPVEKYAAVIAAADEALKATTDMLD